MESLKQSPTVPPKDVDKSKILKENKKLVKEIAAYQDVLYAQGKYSLLIILQGLDASGKNSATKKIFRMVNPMGLVATGFTKPTEKELKHDFLWRIHRHTPMNGMIRIFNRSHYEDVTVTRVKKMIDDEEARHRFMLINSFESLLKSNDTIVLKFFLHISEEEQKQRFKKRLLRSDKHWKFSEDDFLSSKHRDEFLDHYEEVFRQCNKPFPWILVPADKKWFARNIIAKNVANTLKNLPLEYPPLEV